MDHKPKGEALVRFETWNQGLCFCLWCLLAWLSLLCTQRTSRRCERRHTSCREPRHVQTGHESDANATEARMYLTKAVPHPTLLTQQWSSMSFPFFKLCNACARCVFLFVPGLSAFFFFLGPFVHLGSVTIRSLPAGCSSTWPSSSFKCKLKRTEGEDMWRSPSPGQLHKLYQIVIKYLYHPLPVPDPLKITGFARSYII